jgi:hypothetical protein
VRWHWSVLASVVSWISDRCGGRDKPTGNPLDPKQLRQVVHAGKRVGTEGELDTAQKDCPSYGDREFDPCPSDGESVSAVDSSAGRKELRGFAAVCAYLGTRKPPKPVRYGGSG